MASPFFPRFPSISRLWMAALIGSLWYLRALWLVRCEHFGIRFTAVIISFLFSLQSCDFYFDNPKEANERGFNFEPLKVRVFLIIFSSILCLVFHSLLCRLSFWSLFNLSWERLPDGDWVVCNLCLFLISGGCWYWREKEHRVSMATSCRSWRKWQSYFTLNWGLLR